MWQTNDRDRVIAKRTGVMSMVMKMATRRKEKNVECTLELGWPPSTNQTWRSYSRNGRHCVILSEKARMYRLDVASRVAAGRAHGDIPGVAFDVPLGVEIRLRRPDNRRRDLDNSTKSLLDSLTKAGVWTDDSLVHDLRLRWDGVEKPGKVTVKIRELEE